jgi:hypothetical protein
MRFMNLDEHGERWATEEMLRLSDGRQAGRCKKCDPRPRRDRPKRHHALCPLRGAGTRRHLVRLVRRVCEGRDYRERGLSGREVRWLARHLDIVARIEGPAEPAKFVEAFDRALDRFAGLFRTRRRYPLPKLRVALLDATDGCCGPLILRFPDGSALYEASGAQNDDTMPHILPQEPSATLAAPGREVERTPTRRIEMLVGHRFEDRAKNTVIVFTMHRDDPRAPDLVPLVTRLAEIDACPDWLAAERHEARRHLLRQARARGKGGIVTINDVRTYALPPGDRRFSFDEIRWAIERATNACLVAGPIITHADRLRVMCHAVDLLRQAQPYTRISL